MMHTNICSLEGSFDKLELLLHNLDYNLDVTALTETWHVERNKTFVSLLHGIWSFDHQKTQDVGSIFTI